MTFQPIAIVGQACVVPGAFSPDALWELVAEGRDAFSTVPPERWRADRRSLLITAADRDRGAEGCVSDRGAFVRGFDDLFEPDRYPLDGVTASELDPAVRWLLHAGREALIAARLEPGRARLEKVGAIVGNLAYPTANLARFAEARWLETGSVAQQQRPVHPLNRFSAGLPVHLMCQALGLGAGGYALDAACASSFYAIKLACDWLRTGRADAMLAGGINCIDTLVLHAGFTALGALSPSGQSRPFHRDADGLLPAEGVALLVLKRLDDAIAEGHPILGVIRGIGLSNDGNAGGLLAPDVGGQARALRTAYAAAGLSPADISLIECHATGTKLGDATEIEALSRLYQGTADVPLGSLKSNLGHLITAAGAAGLIKVLMAMRHAVRPASLRADPETDALAGSPFRILSRAEPWTAQGPRRAAVSAFGFGGCNAHLLVEEWQATSGTAAKPAQAPPRPRIAVVGMGAQIADGRSAEDFRRELLAVTPQLVDTPLGRPAPAATIELPYQNLRFPPRDLEHALPQQLMVMGAAIEAASSVTFAPERAAVLIGMQCDAEACRLGLRLRLPMLLPKVDRDKQGLTPSDAAFVLGCMPNILANRLNIRMDIGGPSFVIAAEELSGLRALEIAIQALSDGEIDAAIVGAVDLCVEPVHQSAAQAVFPTDRHLPGDGACALVLKRAEDAERDGDRIHALVEHVRPEGTAGTETQGFADAVRRRFGHIHAAAGLIDLLAGMVVVRDGVMPPTQQLPTAPWLHDDAARRLQLSTVALGGQKATFSLREPQRLAAEPFVVDTVPDIWIYSAQTVADLKTAVLADRFEPVETAHAPMTEPRLVLVATAAERQSRLAECAAYLDRLAGPLPQGMFFRAAAVGGEIGFVFTGSAAAYAGMGRELVLALPDVMARLRQRATYLRRAAWVYERPATEKSSSFEQLCGASFLSQFHAELTRGLLCIAPTAALGISSGETNALFALGAWTGIEALLADVEAAGIYTTELAGDYRAVRAWWREHGITGESWAHYQILAPVAEVAEAVASERGAHLAIINAPKDCIIAGEAAACARVVEKIGGQRAMALDFDLAVHCPPLQPVAELWRRLHHRPTEAPPGIRFYGNAWGDHYQLSDDRVAEALMTQAVSTVDFPRTVQKAWADGVRVFIEHGPRGLCSKWIGETLADRPHAAITLDVAGRSSLRQAIDAVAELVACGVPAKLCALREALRLDRSLAAPAVPVIRFPAHPPRIDFARKPHDDAATPPGAAERMAAAPALRGAPNGGLSTDPSATGFARQRSADQGLLDPGQRTKTVPPRAARPSSTNDDSPNRISSNQVISDQVLRNEASPIQASTAQDPSVQPVPLLVSLLRDSLNLESNRESNQKPDQAPDRGLSSREVSLPAATALFDTIVSGHESMSRNHSEFVARFQQLQTGFQTISTATLQTVVRQVVRPTPQLPSPSSPRRPRPIAAPSPMARPASISPTAPKPMALPTSTPPSAPTAAPKPATPPTSTSPTAEAGTALPGPKFDRAQLELLASGKISSLLGPLFARQDGFRRQVRMPQPPLLLADRVTGIDAEPGSMAKGTIWTETDVTADAWYLHCGRMPAGITVESGQADLLLISWLGADIENRGERVYRLLGCDLTFHGGLPQVSDKVCHDIHVDGHARHGNVRLFFFHSDCKIDGKSRMSVRNGQAGFFTDEELANSDGVIWSAETGEHLPAERCRLDPPAVHCTRSQFDAASVRAFAEGRAFECFGPGFELAGSHTRTPAFPPGRMQLIREVEALEPAGGPWGRGYLRANWTVSPTDWFFDGHFKNDPCMPGTLMFEACLQTMAFVMAGLGFTLQRDGWRFEPVPESTSRLICRGQVTPQSARLVYEVFVEEVIAGPEPTLYADLLCTVDGLKAFHCRRMGLRLVPGWPLEVIGSTADTAKGGDGGVPLGHDALLACAIGRPSDAFGRSLYSRFDGPSRVPRLPGPPYHFMTRIRGVEGEPGGMRVGSEVVAEYDVPEDDWYFRDNGSRTMPYAVLMEVALQPCGWLASFVGCTIQAQGELFFRNLDGKATQLCEVTPGCGTLLTRCRLKSFSRVGTMTIVSFDIVMRLGDALVYQAESTFGFFPQEALANQVGLPADAAEVAALAAPDNLVIHLQAPAPLESGIGFARRPLLMVDRVTGYWPEGGRAGLGMIRGEKDVDPTEWFFKAHFFQDPVQPGSLGVEAILQLLQCYVAHSGLTKDMTAPRFEPIALGREGIWKYRGQVLPSNRKVSVLVELTERGEDDRGVYAMAVASLWVDGRKIYEMPQVGMRAVPGSGAGTTDTGSAGIEAVFDVATSPWLKDHCPSFAIPTLAMAEVADFAARGAATVGKGVIVAIENLQLRRWVAVNRPLRLRAVPTLAPNGEQVDVSLEVWRESARAALSRFDQVGTGVVRFAASYPPAPPPLPPRHDLPCVHQLGSQEHGDLYVNGNLFHGPAFRVLRELFRGPDGAVGFIDAALGAVPVSCINPIIIDGITHCVPNDEPSLWSPDIPAGMATFPVMIRRLAFYSPPQSWQQVECRIRPRGFEDEARRRPWFHGQLLSSERVVAEVEFVFALIPIGPVSRLQREYRGRFLRDRQFVPGAGLGQSIDGRTLLPEGDILATDWVPGTVATVYGCEGVEDRTTLLRQVAVKQHVAQRAKVHPAMITFAAGESVAASACLPLQRFPVSVQDRGGAVEVADAGPPIRDYDQVRAAAMRRSGLPNGVVLDLYMGLIERFLGRFMIVDPARAIRRRPVLYLANHQTYLEGVVFNVVASAVFDCPVQTVIKTEHFHDWVGRLDHFTCSHPQARLGATVSYFDQSKPESLATIFADFLALTTQAPHSQLIFVEGKRARSCRQYVRKVSSMITDFAVEHGFPIVPVRISGGLPVEPVTMKLDFPLGLAAQDYVVGNPLLPEELRVLPLKQRSDRVVDAINTLPPGADDAPAPSADAFVARVERRRREAGVSEAKALLWETLAALAEPSAETRMLLHETGGQSASPWLDGLREWLTTP